MNAAPSADVINAGEEASPVVTLWDPVYDYNVPVIVRNTFLEVGARSNSFDEFIEERKVKSSPPAYDPSSEAPKPPAAAAPTLPPAPLLPPRFQQASTSAAPAGAPVGAWNTGAPVWEPIQAAYPQYGDAALLPTPYGMPSQGPHLQYGDAASLPYGDVASMPYGGESWNATYPPAWESCGVGGGMAPEMQHDFSAAATCASFPSAPPRRPNGAVLAAQLAAAGYAGHSEAYAGHSEAYALPVAPSMPPSQQYAAYAPPVAPPMPPSQHYAGLPTSSSSWRQPQDAAPPAAGRGTHLGTRHLYDILQIAPLVAAPDAMTGETGQSWSQPSAPGWEGQPQRPAPVRPRHGSSGHLVCAVADEPLDSGEDDDDESEARLALGNSETAELGSHSCPTLGSRGHTKLMCKPCAFVMKGCQSGADCKFCHLCEVGEKKRRKKEKVATRREVQRTRQPVARGPHSESATPASEDTSGTWKLGSLW